MTFCRFTDLLVQGDATFGLIHCQLNCSSVFVGEGSALISHINCFYHIEKQKNSYLLDSFPFVHSFEVWEVMIWTFTYEVVIRSLFLQLDVYNFFSCIWQGSHRYESVVCGPFIYILHMSHWPSDMVHHYILVILLCSFMLILIFNFSTEVRVLWEKEVQDKDCATNIYVSF